MLCRQLFWLLFSSLALGQGLEGALEPARWHSLALHFESEVTLSTAIGESGASLWILTLGTLKAVWLKGPNGEKEIPSETADGFLGLIPLNASKASLRLEGDGECHVYWLPESNWVGKGRLQKSPEDGGPQSFASTLPKSAGTEIPVIREWQKFLDELERLHGEQEHRYLAFVNLVESALSSPDTPSAWQASLHLFWGNRALNQGYFSDAETHFKKSETLWEQLGYRENLARSQMGLAMVKVTVGELDAARLYLEQGQAQLPAHHAIHLDFAIELGWLEIRGKNFGKAIDHFQKLQKSLIRATPLQRGAVLDRLGSAYLEAGKFAMAGETYRKAVQIYLGAGESSEIPITWSNYAEALRRQKKYEAAVTMAKRSLDHLGDEDKREIQATNYWVMALSQWELGRFEESLSNFDKAMQQIEAIRSAARGGDLGQQFFQAAFEFAEDYLHALYQLHQRNPEKGYHRRAFLLQESWRRGALLANLTRDNPGPPNQENAHLLLRLQRLALESHWGQQQAVRQREAEVLAETLAVQELPRRSWEGQFAEPLFEDLAQPDDVLVLAYVMGEKYGFVWTLHESHLVWQELPQMERLRKKLERWNETFEADSPIEKPQQKRLMDKIRRDLLPEGLPLDRVSRVVVLPDGPLTQFPFNLVLSQPTKISDYWPTHAVEIRDYLPPLPMPDSVASGVGILVLADPVYDKRSLREAKSRHASPSSPTLLDESRGEGLPRLKGTHQEALDIQKFAEGTPVHILERGEATREHWLLANPEKFQVLHLGSHGVIVPEKPELSGMVLGLYDAEGQEVPGFLSRYDIERMQLCAELVVLSGCWTALGRTYQVGGMWGLNRAFRQAGAKTVLASTWRVSDAATAAWMAFFYQAYLKENQDVAAAALTAQRRMLLETDWQHPKFWASFQAFGPSGTFKKK